MPRTTTAATKPPANALVGVPCLPLLTSSFHSLALDASDRQPLRWRLLLIRHDASTLELNGYNNVLEPEEERWREVCELGQQVARHLVVPLLLPQEQERARRLQVVAGEPLTIHYPSC